MTRAATDPFVHRFTASAMPVNAYLVETARGVVAVDGTLAVSDARALRRLADELGKPLAGVLVTHAHPDHYAGIGELLAGDDVPVVAARGVDEVIRRDDELKDRVIAPMFGDEWPRERRFPDQTLEGGATIELGGVDFTLIDLGPGESPHDSAWLVGEGRPAVFAGDAVYQRMHCYLADGYWESWLANIERLRADLPPGAELHFGHGDPAPSELFDWQAGYIRTFVAAVESADWTRPEAAKASVSAEMLRYLPSEDLRFLMELSIEPVAASLGLVETH